MDKPYSDEAQEIIDCLYQIIDEINARSLDVSFIENKLDLFDENIKSLREIYKISQFSESQVCSINKLKEIAKNLIPKYTMSNGARFYLGKDGVYRNKQSHMSYVPSLGIAPPEITRSRTVYNTPTAIPSATDGDNHGDNHY
jgi:hypothetical protein